MLTATSPIPHQYAQFDMNPSHKNTLPRQEPPHILLPWEVLGPLPVGKLEMDGDPTFIAACGDRSGGGCGGGRGSRGGSYGNSNDNNNRGNPSSSQDRGFDFALYVLSLHHKYGTVVSEMAEDGVKWKGFRARDDGLVSTTRTTRTARTTRTCSGLN